MSQKLKPNRSDNRGGSRENAGAKPLGNKKFARWVTPDEFDKLEEFLKNIRKNN